MSKTKFKVTDLPRLTDEDRWALDVGGIAMQGVPSGDDLSSLTRSFEELGRGAVADSDQVLACLKELEQRRAGVPAGDELPRFHHHLTGVDIACLPDPAPCPFCKKLEFAGIETREGAVPDDTTYCVPCDTCDCEGPSVGSLLEAAQLWNAGSEHNAQ